MAVAGHRLVKTLLKKTTRGATDPQGKIKDSILCASAPPHEELEMPVFHAKFAMSLRYHRGKLFINRRLCLTTR